MAAMATDKRLSSGVHPDYVREAQELSARLNERAGPEVLQVLTEHAQAAARELDDNHTGTEHIVLGLFRNGPNAATAILEQHGITDEVFRSVLDDEPGPSPSGPIPYTVRAMMIGGQATMAADSESANEVGLRHLLAGVVHESQRWSTQHAWGPHHLRRAAETAGSSLEELTAAITTTPA